MPEFDSPLVGKKPWRWGDLLEEMYWDHGLAVEEIADHWECSPSTISEWLDRHGIETRRRGPGTPEKLTSRDWLREQYVEKRRDGIEMPKVWGVKRTRCIAG